MQRRRTASVPLRGPPGLLRPAIRGVATSATLGSVYPPSLARPSLAALLTSALPRERADRSDVFTNALHWGRRTN